MAGERSGPVLVVRSAASPGGGVPFGGPKPGFESVRLVNFNNSPAFSTRVNNSSEVTPLPQFEPLRAKHLNALASFGDVLRFNAESVAKTDIPANPEPIQIPEAKAEPVLETKLRNGVFVRAARAESLSLLRAGEIKLPVERTLSPVEQAAIRMRADQLRARLLRPQIQAIPMVSEQAQAIMQAQPASEAAVVKNEQALTEPQVKSEQVTPMPLRNVRNDSLRMNKREVIKITQEKAVVDYRVNRLRINALMATRDRIRALGKGDLRDEIVKESGINESRELRSSILELVDRTSEDGTQPRTGDEIVSNQGELTNQEIEVTVFNHTAVRNATEGDEVGRKQLYEVATLPREPFSTFDEEQILPKKQEVVHVKEIESVPVNLQVGLPVDEKFEEGQKDLLQEAAPVDILSRPLGLFNSSISSIWDMSLYSRIQREELVFN